MPMASSDAARGHLVVVDDDALFRESVMRNLDDAGFSVTGFPNGVDTLDSLRNGQQADILLLDWKMPELSGIEVLRHMREERIDIPVIFLTVLGDQIYEEAALLGGAVDFVEKSRSFSILLRRIELILAGSRGAEGRAARTFEQDTIRCGPLQLTLDTQRAYWNERQVDLTLTEFRLVQFMVDHAGRDIGYRELYDQVHGENFIAGEGEIGYRANVRAFIKRIRQKFRNVDRAFTQIENYPGFGYRWRDDAAS